MMVRGASNLPAVARFPAAFYLLIQRGFVRTPRLHLEPAEESVLHQIQEENHCMLRKKKENFNDKKKTLIVKVTNTILVRILPCGSELL